MNNLVAEQFRAALNILLHQEGRGSPVRLAVAQNIDRGYLNAVIKGKKPAAEEIRLKIADHFGMLYEQMLAFGRHIQEGRIPAPAKEIAEFPDQEYVRMPVNETIREFQGQDIAGTIQMALALLNSGLNYNNALTRAITILYRTMLESGQRKADIEDDRFQEVEKRLEQLETYVLKKNHKKR